MHLRSIGPAMRDIVGGRAKQGSAGSTRGLGGFGTQVPTQPMNVEAALPTELSAVSEQV